MRKFVFPLAILATFTNCALRSPLVGGLYTGVVAGNSVSAQAGPKTGESCALSIIGLVAVGDAGIDAARKNGGITSISIVDEKSTTILFGLYSQHCTIVHGK